MNNITRKKDNNVKGSIMNRKEHQNFAKLVAQKTLEEELQSKNLPWNILCDIAVEWIGNNIGVLPDKLEPATNMYHRNLFHKR